MNKFFAFVRASKEEMTENVSWLSFREAQDSSLLVLVASVIFALVIGGVDYLFSTALEMFYNAF